MPPKSCPLHLQRLIDRENELPATDPHPLRQIRKAYQAKKQGKGPDTVAIDSRSLVTFGLIDCAVTVQNEIAVALAEIDSPRMVDLIRDCRVCGDLFWAGRGDKWACRKHVARWRKREYRQKQRGKREEIRAAEATATIQKTIRELSPTARAVITAIMSGYHQARVFEDIDWYACYELRQSREMKLIAMERIPTTFIVRQTCDMLVRRGYLTYHESARAREDRYEPTDKLFTLWAAMTGRPDPNR